MNCSFPKNLNCLNHFHLVWTWQWGIYNPKYSIDSRACAEGWLYILEYPQIISFIWVSNWLDGMLRERNNWNHVCLDRIYWSFWSCFCPCINPNVAAVLSIIIFGCGLKYRNLIYIIYGLRRWWSPDQQQPSG